MIRKINSISNFHTNAKRTEMLITAMSKLKTYNWIYQQKAYDIHPKHHEAVKKSQDKELIKIEVSCSEHALISLSTNFEVYYKDLIQELLNKFSTFFTSKETKHKNIIGELVSSRKRNTYEIILNKLNIKNRFDVYDFFELFGIPFLTQDEKKIMEHIYIIRNQYVHNAGRKDKQTKIKLKKYPSPTHEGYLTTETKRLRTKFNRLIDKSYIRTMDYLNNYNS
ncbi:hypothetical protein HQ533_03105 [Candidatus Woesearchaeota archaeon]|nr:hypothetical protein [Candidatus Woesearchaeota archaeon]